MIRGMQEGVLTGTTWAEATWCGMASGARSELVHRSGGSSDGHMLCMGGLRCKFRLAGHGH